ncbi:MAG TPA: hypothetical protein PLF84_23335, partial [Bryobacteraceae bacterium]|nr:hypothetical protein [Bryobacteraceae bacterium]
MTFLHFNRRAHLYLGLGLLPWFLVYGVSSIPFAHSQYFEELDKAKGLPLWKLREERKYRIAVPAEGDLRPVGARIMKDLGLEGSFGTYRQGERQVNVYIHTFLKSTQVKYFVEEGRVTVEERRFRWDHFLTGMHARGGFEQDGWLTKAGGVAEVASVGGFVKEY